MPKDGSSQFQNLASSVFCVPHSLDSGNLKAPNLIPKPQRQESRIPNPATPNRSAVVHTILARCRANTARMRQSRPDSCIGLSHFQTDGKHSRELRSLNPQPRTLHPEPLIHVRSAIVQREFVVGNLLVRNHFMILMIRWTGLAPREFGLCFPGSLTSISLQYTPYQHASNTVASPAVIAAKRGGNSLTYFSDIRLKMAQANFRIWPYLSLVCHIRSPAEI